MVPGWNAEVLGDLPQAVVDTITSARAPSTRCAYTLKWNLFIEWCSIHREDPRTCPIRAVLSFLQVGLEQRLSPATLKVYVAAIAAHQDLVDGESLGKHNLTIRFLRGERRLNPPHSTRIILGSPSGAYGIAEGPFRAVACALILLFSSVPHKANPVDFLHHPRQPDGQSIRR